MHIILGLASTEIFGKSSLIIYSILGTLIIYMLYKKKFIYPKNTNFYILIAFSTMYLLLLYILDSTKFSTFLCLGFPISYYCGIVICEFCNKDENYILKCVVAIALGFFVHAMLNYVINIGTNNRNTVDFWTKNLLSATLQGTMLTMIMSMLFWILFYVKKIREKVICLVCIILAIMYLTVIATRTTLIIAIIVFLLEIIIDCLINKQTTRLIKIVGVLLICIIIIGAIYFNNLGGIQERLENSNLMRRIGKSETVRSDQSRFKSQITGLKSLLENPMGMKEDNITYVHYMWLDIGKEAGIIPFLFLTIYTISTFLSMIGILTNKNISNKYKILISSIYLGVNINFAVEPIIQGTPFYFSIFVIINGMVDTQYYYLKKEKKDESTLDSKHNISISSTTT